jgi:polysaccharide deacetylase 2 family uncharacterized protein YibQ
VAAKIREHSLTPRRWPSLTCLWLVLCLLAGLEACGKHPPTTAELRTITHEIVSAAQRVTGHKSEITIRPEHVQLPAGEGLAPVSTDHIYITLSDPAQKMELERALDEVARRHGLSRAGLTVAAGVIRFDYEKDGRRTHAIHIVTPVALRPPVRAQLSGGPQLAIILDDLGYDRASADAVFTIPFPLTVSVLPHLPLSTEVAEEAHRRGDQVLLHLPMASTGDVRPEAIELRPGMKPEEVGNVLSEMLNTVPHASGVNNHQGSLATADPQLMAALMPALRQHGLFFIDSRTTVATVAYDTAERDGVRAAYRTTFLDDTPTREAVLAQLESAARKAQRQGWAIAIGHPHPGTLAALEQGLPRLEARGIRLVFASDLTH